MSVKVYVGLRVRWPSDNRDDWTGIVDYVDGPEIGVKLDHWPWSMGWDLHKPPYELLTESGEQICA